MNPVFFSYATEDRERLTPYIRAFQALNIAVLIDHQQILPGGAIPQGINQMITQSQGAVIFHSGSYQRKPWTNEEQNALMYRAVALSDYRLIVVRLDRAAELPPLLEHRVWFSGTDANVLAAVFSGNIRQALRLAFEDTSASDKAFPNWLQTLRDDELERMGHLIKNELEQQLSTTNVRLRSREAGELVVHLAQPLVMKQFGSLRRTLSIHERVSFIREELREQIRTGNLGPLRGAFLLEEREKISQLEETRSELHAALDAIVLQVTLA